MAQITICDVKSCGEIIKTSADLKTTTIAGTSYQLCKKCYDGLLKFIEENLLKLGSDALTKIDNKEFDAAAKELAGYLKKYSTPIWTVQQNPNLYHPTSTGILGVGTNPGFYVATNPAVMGTTDAYGFGKSDTDVEDK